MLRIELPLPPKSLHPNAGKPASRGGKIGQSRLKAKARADGNLAAVAALANSGMSLIARPKWARATIKALFRFKVKRQHDPDNLIASLKHYIDGIADAGVIENDSGLVWLPPRVEKVNRSAPRSGVVLEIEPIT